MKDLCRIVNERRFEDNRLAHVLYYIYRKITKDETSFIRYRYQGIFGKEIPPVAISIGGDNYCYDSMLHDLRLANKAFTEKEVNTVLLGCSIEPELLDNEEFCDELFSVYPFLRGKLENRKGVIEEDVDDIPAETTITTKIYEGSEENSDLNGTGNPTDISDFDTSSFDASDSDNGHDANATQDANPSSSDNTGQQTSSQAEGSEIDNEDAETIDTDQRTGTNTGSTASGQKIDTTSGQQTYTSGNGSNTNWQQPNTSSNGSTSTESERQSPNVTPMEELKGRTRRPQNSVFGDEDSVAEKYKPSGAPVDLTGWKKERKPYPSFEFFYINFNN